MNSFRKIFTAGLMMMTILSLTVIVAPSANAAASAGDLIKMNGTSSVYYLGANGKRYVFPNESTYFSWYKDFSGVVTVPQSEMETYPLAANVTVRPGTKLVKSPSINTVYAVEPGGVLRSIVSEANAQLLWGATWNKQVIDVIDSFFTNYTVGAPLTAGVYPAGQLFKTAGSPDAYVMGTDGKARKFGSEAAFLANGYAMDKIATVASTFVMPAAGSAINGREDGLADVSQGGGAGNGVVAGTGISVALASDTPAAASVPTNSPSDFLKFNVTASNDGAATISSLKLTSSGLGAGADIDNVTIYVDGARVGTAKNVDSNKEATFNFSSGIAIPAGQTKAISVRASVSGTNQYALGIAKASDVIATGATISGSFPVNGNIMSGVSLVVGQVTATLGSAPSDVKLGDKAATIASLKLSNDNDKEDISVSSITLKKTDGSATDASFENVGLYVNGTKVASSMGLKDKFVTFTFDTAYVVKKGNDKTFEVKADVIDGANKDITLSLDSTSDIVAMGNLYGTYAKVAGATPLDVSSDVNILAGDVALAKEQAANDKVRKDTSDVVLGTIKVTPNTGKNVELRTLIVTVSTSTGVTQADIENVEVMDKATGLSYELSWTATGKYSNTSVGMNLVSGVTKELVIRLDIKDTAANGDTFAASIAAASTDFKVYDEDNVAVTDITPSSITFNTVTVEQPTLTLSVNPLSSAMTAVSGTSDIEVLNFNLKANSTDSLKVTQIVLTDEDGTTISSSILSQVRLYKAGETTPIKALAGSKVGETLTFDGLNINVPAGQEVKYRVTADITSGASGATKWGVSAAPTVEDVTKGDSMTVANGGVLGYTAGMDSGRTVTIAAAGNLIVEMDNSNTETNKARYEIAGNTTGFLAAIKVRAANESVKIQDLRVTIKDSDTTGASTTVANSIFSKLQIVGEDKVTVLKEVSNVTDETVITGLDLVVPVGVKTFYLKGVLNPIGKDLVGVNNKDIKFAVNEIIAKGESSSALLTPIRASSSASCADSKVCYVTDSERAWYSTGSSTATGIISSKISAVELVQTGGGASMSNSLTGGSNVVAILKVTTDNTSNTLANGDELKTLLGTIKLNVTETAVDTVTYGIEKAGGIDTAISGVASSTGTVTLTVGSSWANDDSLAKQTTAYYVVRATVSGISATAGASAIQVDLNNLDGDVTTGNFTWQDSSDAASKYPLRLSTNKVSGIKVTN